MYDTNTVAGMIDAIVNGTTRLDRFMGADRLHATDGNGNTYHVEFSNGPHGAVTLLDIDCRFSFGGDIPLHGIPALIARDARNTLRTTRN